MKELTKPKDNQETNATPENEDLINDNVVHPDITISQPMETARDTTIEESFLEDPVVSEEDTLTEDLTEIKTGNSFMIEDEVSPKSQSNDNQIQEISKPIIEEASNIEETKDTIVADEKIIVASMPTYYHSEAEKENQTNEMEDTRIETEIAAYEAMSKQESAAMITSSDEGIHEEVKETVNEPEESPVTERTISAADEEKKAALPRHHKVWDILLSFLLLILSCFFLYRLYTISILSFDWIWKIALSIAIVELALFLTAILCRFPTWAIWLRRSFICLLCILFTFAGITVNTLQNSLQDITKPETATTVNVSLITKKDGGAKQLTELSEKKIGIQNANDAANSSYVREQLDKEKGLNNVTYVEGLDYESLYQKLMNEEIDALIITDYYFKTLLKEDHPTIEDDIFILKSYQKKKEIDLSTSNKDIRYEPFTVYLAGVDEGDDPSIDARSDVNIVLMVNPLANHIEMVSIPRDSFVPNPALYGNNDKLTHLGLNGVNNSIEGLEAVLGFEIDYYVKLNFFSVIDIIDAIGTIEVDVPTSFCEQDENRSFAKKDLICLKKGVQRINGKQALAFARHRKSYTDVMRGKAQQEVIKGIINELTTPNGVANINNVLKIASNTISTNMPLEQVTNFVSAQIDHLKPWTIDSIVLENGADARLVTASMPGQELYVMLLNRLDIQKVYEAYQSMLNQMQFSSFTFHLDHLTQETHKLPDTPGIIWAGSDVSGHLLNQPSEPINQESTPPISEPTPAPEESQDNPETPDETLPPQDDPSETNPEPTPEEPLPEEPTPNVPDNQPTTTQ